MDIHVTPLDANAELKGDFSLMLEYGTMPGRGGVGWGAGWVFGGLEVQALAGV